MATTTDGYTPYQPYPGWRPEPVPRPPVTITVSGTWDEPGAYEAMLDAMGIDEAALERWERTMAQWRRIQWPLLVWALWLAMGDKGES
jgi:hypothetical protein